MELTRQINFNGFRFSTDKKWLDVNYIHRFLSEESYWANGIPLDIVIRSIENSLCIGVYENEKQVGFARLITDYSTFGYLADVFVDKVHRGKGLSKKLMEFILSFEELRSFRRIVLSTRDAHGLYAQFGFEPLKKPDSFMELHRPDIYTRRNKTT